MDYKVNVISRQDRIVRIEQEKATATRTDPFIFRGKPVQLDVIRVPIELPVYRMNNGRTRLKQAEYSLHNKLSPDYFLTAEEDAAAQQVQHKLLLELARDLRASIYDELKYRAVQTESLLVTSSGVVVNGNRRLSAMRHLIVNESDSHESFNFVDVAVLPAEATLEDIEEIESELQEVPETKLEYDWISRRLKLRYRRDVLRFTTEKLLKMYRFKSKEDINRELQQLQLSEEYLERYLGKPGEYEMVEQSEEIIRQLQAALENKTPEDAEMGKLVAFPLIKEARDLGSRAYEFRNAFGSDLEEVLNRLAVEHDVKIAPPQVASPTNGPDLSTPVPTDTADDDPLEGITDKQPERFVDLKPILLDGNRSKDVAGQLVRISGSIRQEKREGGRKLVALKNAEAANRFVHEIDLNGADPGTFPQISAQLEACISEAQKIVSNIAQLPKTKEPKA